MRAGVALLILPLSACDLLFQLQHVDPADGGGTAGDAGAACAGTRSLHTAFTDDVELARSWDKETETNSSVTIVDHTLALTVGVPTGYVDAITNTTFDVRGGTVQVQLVEPFFAADAEMFLGVHLPTPDRQRCYIGLTSDGTPEGANLGFVCKTDVTMIGVPKYVPFDATAHRYWRMVQTGIGMTFFTSSDAEVWTMRHQIDTPTFAYDAVHFVLGAGSYSPGVMQAQTVRYDDLDYCAP